jgi:P27 family predicted phage terminase small subunit
VKGEKPWGEGSERRFLAGIPARRRLNTFARSWRKTRRKNILRVKSSFFVGKRGSIRTKAARNPEVPMSNPPVPFVLKALRGNPGKRAMKPEPQPERPPTCPSAPSYLAPYARAEWERIAPQLFNLGLLTVLDISPLAAYCSAFATWQSASEALARMAANDRHSSGQLVRNKYGDVNTNPLLNIARKAAADVVQFGSQFGLSPAARARIAAGPNAPQPPGKFDGLLR